MKIEDLEDKLKNSDDMYSYYFQQCCSLSRKIHELEKEIEGCGRMVSPFKMIVSWSVAPTFTPFPTECGKSSEFSLWFVSFSFDMFVRNL